MQYRDDNSMTRNPSDRSDNRYGSSRDRDRNSAFDFGSDDRYGRDQGRDSGSWRSSQSYVEERSRGRFGRSGVDAHDLIASDRVEGTAVYGRNGNKLGSIHNFMVEKRGGRVAFAVMKCSSGFLGMDERYYPLNWSELDYDTQRDGYTVDMSERDLDHRRSFDSRGHPVENQSNDRNSDRSSW
jgi:hypothetical protein